MSRARRREFGSIKRRASGRYTASYIGADGLRHFAGRSFATKADAQAWLAARQSELHLGTSTDPALGRLGLAEFGARWIAEHKLSPRTRDLYSSLFRLHIEPSLGSRPLDQLTRKRSVRGAPACMTRAARSRRLPRATGCCGAILNTAVDDGRIPRNPCCIKGADRENSPERPAASVQEISLLADRIGTTYRASVLTAAFASLRWGELAALRRRDLDVEIGLIFVRRSMVELGGSLEIALPKNNRTRTVAMPGVLIERLKEHLHGVPLDPEAPVFSGERGGVP